MADGSYWQRNSAPRGPWTASALPPRVDFAVIGGGISGLSTALRLRELEPAAAIALFEARRIAHGASGRNAGLLSPVAVPLWLLGAHRRGEWAWGIRHANRAMGKAARWIERMAPGAELAEATLRIASGHRVVDAGLVEFAAALTDANVESKLSRGASQSRADLRMAAFTVNPFSLVEELGRAALTRDIHVCEATEVVRITPSTVGTRLHLRPGDSDSSELRDHLDAKRVLVCTNGPPRALGVRDRVAAAFSHSFMVASSPAADAGGRTTLHDHRNSDGANGAHFTVEVGPTELYHRTHRGRALLGGLDSWRAPASDFAVPDAIRRRLSRFVEERYPAAEVDQAWSGRLHVTATGLPIVRRSRRWPSVFYNVGYGGTGMTLALAMAPIAAAMASDRKFARPEDERFATLVERTRIPVGGAARALAKIAWRAAVPWLAPSARPRSKG